MTPPDPTHIFHITALENLQQILAAGELRAKRSLEQEDTGYTNIAHTTIQDRRLHTPVPCGPGGVLHDYVPFYFGPRSPMLFTLSKGNVEGFTGGQQSIVHIVSSVQRVEAAELGFVFTDGHGIMELTDFYDDLIGLNEIDWPLMRAHYWADTDEDPDRKRRRQAEFLVHGRFPVELIIGIGVMNEHIKEAAETLIRRSGLNIPVAVKAGWYY
ncbi:type II toxin-antitoxin system toxin DNA ADP-ribosyl transferase DarT [Halomonas sp. 18071143]|uniref:type II toxin-antitoxin system toxin DNA ADP-ribosyl transferase DarT n=1 Tax=Halomonas sp. 18071143 TaxID=2855441 RepID=UPI001C4661E4|nr:DUF4433 domain-containing protein [Halomonas sp. 18071143]